jgi:hypothetical protein
MEKVPSELQADLAVNQWGYVKTIVLNTLHRLTASQRGFYVALALVPLSMVAYTFASSSDTPVLTRIIDAYRSREEEVVRRNTLHQIACEQAALDRHLFHGEQGGMIGVDIRFPE